MGSTGLAESFVAAIQASLSVLLVIFYGGVAAWLGLLGGSSTRAISKVCVRMFLPALLFTKIGSELHAGSAYRYGIVLVWAVAAHALSFAVGTAAHLLLGMPDWTTVAVMFNNTTSYPLLLVGALEQTGILQSLIVSGGGGGTDETTRAAMERAKSYFLVFSTVSSCLTFAVGPRLIDSEHLPGPEDYDDDSEEDGGDAKIPESPENPESVQTSNIDDGNANNDDNDELSGPGRFRARLLSESGHDPLSAPPLVPSAATEETALLQPQPPPSRSSVVRFVDPFAPSNRFFPSTRKMSGKSAASSEPASALAPAPTSDDSKTLRRRRFSIVPKKHWALLGPRARWWLLFAADFFNAPMLGALAGAVVGLSPPLHRAFFNDASDGGFLSAWLTASLDDIGGLFVPLPVVVAGVSLYMASLADRLERKSSSSSNNSSNSSINRSRNINGDDGDDDNENNGPAAVPLPWPTVAFILVVRFVIWPAASVAMIYYLASRSTILGDDPMLWFTLMLMPTGPPAMKLITLVQVSNADAADETSIAQLLTISYLISPILSLTVVASLRASQACMRP